MKICQSFEKIEPKLDCKNLLKKAKSLEEKEKNAATLKTLKICENWGGGHKETAKI